MTNSDSNNNSENSALSHAEKKNYILHEVERGLAQQEFHLVYQPIFDLTSHAITSHEAFLRWKHPNQEIIGPADFLPLIEDTPIFIPLMEWILSTACHTQKQFHSINSNAKKIFVKVPETWFHHANFLNTIINLLEQSTLAPEELVIEVKEPTLSNHPAAISILQQLKKIGIYICIGSFGTGSINLHALKDAPIDCVKINRLFVQQAVREQKYANLVKVICHLAKSFNFLMMANGIETRQQLRFLQMNGCDQAQGYLLCTPLKQHIIQHFLTNNKKLFMRA